MNNIKELFKSNKFILLFSMGLTLIMILLSMILSNGGPDTYFELTIIPALSLILGPFAILGFIIIEGIILFITEPNDITSNLIIISLLSISSFLIWKLWYSIMNKEGYELPNLNSLSNLIKLFAIFLLYLTILHILFGEFARGNSYITAIYSNMIEIIPISLVILLWGIHLSVKYKIYPYTPKRQLKQFLPKKSYTIVLILAIIIGIVNTQLIDNLNQSTILTAITILLFIIYLTQPQTGTYPIKEKMELNLINKVIYSILLILVIMLPIMVIIPIYILVPDYFDIYTIIAFFTDITEKFFTLSLIPILIYLYYLEKNMIKPIHKLSESLSRKIDDQKDYQKLKDDLTSINVNNELKSLSNSLLNMENDLNNYRKQLIKVTSQKERYETELKLAHEIQDSMVPKNFKEFNDGNDLEIWGFIKPAREVTGDFYDYFRIDDDNVGFVIGDVSGKGTTASLIMVKAMTLIQDYAKQKKDLSEVFYDVNNLLCEGNVECLFVTCWLGKINTKTKRMSFVNAGHNFPLIKQNENFEYLKMKPEIVLGIMKDVPYEASEIQLKSGDTMILYTDGVTDSNSETREFYGEDRLKNIANKHKNDELEKIRNSVEKDIEDFCGNQVQFDDTTLLAIKLR